MGQANVDVGVFQNTKLTQGIYTRKSSGYKVVATLAPIRHQGKIALLYRESPNFTVEAIQQFSAIFITCQLAMGERHWYTVECYLLSGDRMTIRYMEAVIAESPRET